MATFPNIISDRVSQAGIAWEKLMSSNKAYEGLIGQLGNRLGDLKAAAEAMEIVADDTCEDEKLAVFARGIASLHADLHLTYEALLDLVCEDQKKLKVVEG